MGLVGKNNEEKIWNYLKAAGMTDHGVAGLMGNLYAESGLIPTNMQNSYEKSLGFTDASYTAAVDNGTYGNFVRDQAGYGLAQWTYWSRKESLLEYAKSVKKSIGDLEMQLAFLVKELTAYSGVMAVLKSAKTVQEASDKVLLDFERPADQSQSVKTRRASYGQKYFDKYAGQTTGTTAATAGGKMTARELAEKLTDIAKNYKTLYVMGCFGAPMNDANKKRYCSNHSYNQQAARTAMIQKATADTFGFDCVCLIKGALWGWNGDASKTYGGAGYAINGVPDIGADSMIGVCKEVSGTGWDTMEVGEAVWCKGHIGLYIGNGLAVECTPSWANKVQITAVKNIGTKTGYNARQWTKHGKLPYVTYDGQREHLTPTTPAPSTGGALAYKVGDILDFDGKHYVNANAANGYDCKPGKVKVTAIHKSGKHPYHVIAVAGGGSNAYGWVDAASLGSGSSNSEYTVVKGDSLWAIAQKTLGNGSRYKEIMTLNSLRTTTIHPGQVLKLPK